MKKLIYFLFVTVFCFQVNAKAENISTKPGSSAQFPKSVAGVYKSDFNELTLYVNGNHVTGTYKFKGGKVDGTLSGHTLTGTWSQSNGKGKLIFVFNNDFSAFTGKWGYNNDTPSGKWNGTKIAGGSNAGSTSSTPVSSVSGNSKIAGVYSTDFKNMTLTISGNHVTGTYEHAGGRIDGTLSGHTLTGTWTQTNGKGKLVFVFNNDFSAFTGKWGYNNDAPTSKWNGTKTGSSGSTAASSSTQTSLPINVIGSWSANGSRNQIGRLQIWQDGDKFVVIASWPDAATGTWKSYKGEGRFEGRKMNFKVFPSTTNGSSADQGYVYHYTISPDNSEITSYYTRYGKRTIETNVLYKRVK
ncbi:hypothetical protein PbJCM13498_34550 [Prolixibacter bellariivorans]|uniref:Uncharacterized protein n=1 Tax=Prolixibacter bellariivorans TaxID=314319 RepID=A0A5M4B381_9BACT|nr:hypothetical protein [Prolixibacter bellariivorans]GET34592.1 hypothetical protein PbJCM13498_34550 [Prolixibacter bellariivorans]